MLALFGWLFFLAIMGVGFLVLHQMVVYRSANTYTLTRVAAAISLVAALPWLYYFSGIGFFAGDAVVTSIFLLAFAMAVALGAIYADASPQSTDNLKAFFYAVWIAAMVSAAVGIIQWLSLAEMFGSLYVVQTDVDDRAHGNMGQPNQLTTLLLMGMASLAWLYENERQRIGPWAYGFAAAFLTLALALAQSRTGIVSVCLAVAWLAWKNRRYSHRTRPCQMFAWLALYLLLLQMVPWVQEALLMSEARNTNLTRDNGRLIMWKQMMAGIVESPWFGYGWNQTPTAHAAGSIAYPGHLTFTNAHNAMLDIVAWTGIPVGLVLIGACAYWFISRMRSAHGSNAVYAMAGLIPIGTHSMLEYPFAYAYFLVAAGFFVGIVERSHPRRLTFQLKRSVLLPLLLIFFFAGGRVIYEYMLVEEDFRVVRFENLRIGKTPTDYIAPQNIRLLSHEGVMLKAARFRAKRGMSGEELDDLRMAALRFPYGSLGLRYAMALGLNGDPQGATHFMRVLYGMYGPGYYRAAVATLREFQATEFPELASVETP
jgi:O-antigen ligase